ncbi:purine nucleoside phosphorylase-like [Schistocerca gregaria]|uniref:purine nucleoside phosphorylase-like n=1 Tax=Schistocerca gregaria TaxID=7010 RepID=UPI00211F37BE|nr:purine nucleoside phosphorylase-like [Schistocerca gregaria]
MSGAVSNGVVANGCDTCKASKARSQLQNGHGKHDAINGGPYNTDERESYTYESVMEIAQFLLNRTTIRPKIGIICGSGLGELANTLTKRQAFPYSDIPGFPHSTVAGHAGQLVFGFLEGVEVMCMQGRFHAYEGYPIWKCAMPVRVMKLIGVTHLIATNAAGGINDDLNVGDIMLIKDHISLMGFAGNGPLIGPNDERFGPRFVSMNKAYNVNLRKKAHEVAKQMGISDVVKEGIYCCIGGPNYETVAENRCLKLMGVDAIGMSTVHEVIVARHCGMEVFALSLITNKCALNYDGDQEVCHEEVIEVGRVRAKVLQQLVSNLVPLMIAATASK